VLLVFAGFFLSGVVSAGIVLGGYYRNPLTNGSWSDYAPEFVDVLAQTGLAIAVVLLLSSRRGVTPQTLGLELPRHDDGHVAGGQATRILAWAIFAEVLGGVINAALQTGHYPTSQPNAPELIFATAASIQAGVVEELVVLAFAVVTLRQAGRPLWEVTIVVLVLRGSYHIYYGPGVVGILVWAALFYWIYLRTGNVLVLMVSHAGWDAVGFLSQRWPGVAGLGVLFAIAIWIAAPITWLVERNRLSPAGGWRPAEPVRGRPGGVWSAGEVAQVGGRGPAKPGPGRRPGGMAPTGGWAPTEPAPAALPPAGWQPDPAGVYRWRWWDGQRWTDHVSGP
jgi:membrane protease YdiL (CAAX protease family)